MRKIETELPSEDKFEDKKETIAEFFIDAT